MKSSTNTIVLSRGRGDGAGALAAEPRVVNRYVHSRAKRALDIAIAGAVLVVALPVLLIVAFLVKATSPGPVIFRQQRNGVDGSFDIYKFRTMYHAPEDVPDGFVRQASRGDARVTKVGYWLRRLSLDELPQIVNVLQGKMTVVGPRPHALSHDHYYAKHVDNYMMRYDCRPGITGLAQASGSRGETGTHADMQERVQFDLEYIANASFGMDIKILFMTAQQLLKPHDVY